MRKAPVVYPPRCSPAASPSARLKERLGEPGKPGALRADEILKLTVCEPAMGSGAFLNEAVTQLAHAYLERKQSELGQTIPAEEFLRNPPASNTTSSIIAVMAWT